MDEAEEQALLRIRVLRRDAYRCHHQERPHTPICGAFGTRVGNHPGNDTVVALCLAHAVEVMA